MSVNSRSIVPLLLAIFLTSDLVRICSCRLIDSDDFPDDDYSDLETTIPQGRIRGINRLTHKNRTIVGFLGVPYARPPIGQLRFATALPPDPWNGTFEASKEGNMCPQVESGVFDGDEDCLQLNLFTPGLPSEKNTKLLPVVLHIIGGGFRTLNNSVERYSPDFMLDKDIVLVFPCIRAGVLGFLTTGDEAAPGNYGLKDIVRALEWIRDNIEYFGGDPNQVTLSGGSSGAMGIHLVTLSTLSDGLFHKYITQSGFANVPVYNRPKETCAAKAVILGEHFGCSTTTSQDLVDCLRRVNVSNIVDTASLFYLWQTFPNHVWLPCVEPDIEGALLPVIPNKLMADGKLRDLPWFLSLNREDGYVDSIGFYLDDALFDSFLANITVAIPLILRYNEAIVDYDGFTKELVEYYFNDLTADRKILLDNLTRLAGDAQFYYPAYSALRKHLAVAKNPAYLASFEYRGVFSHSYAFTGGSTEFTGVTHGDEIIYLFGHHGNRLGLANWTFSDSDYVMIDEMVQLWSSFQCNGFPSPLDDKGNSIDWKPYSPLKNALRIGNQSETSLQVAYGRYDENVAFWDYLMEKYFGFII